MSEPVSIYIHVPFCLKKCQYCNFYSVDDLSLITKWSRALVQEIRVGKFRHNWELYDNYEQNSCLQKHSSEIKTLVNTIYFGGGTPSILPLCIVEVILLTIYDVYEVDGLVEISFEVNPGTVDRDYLNGLKKIGINRVSLGIQSFHSGKLQFLGRIHSSQDAVNAIKQVNKCDFDGINLDLIYGLPRETFEEWSQDIFTAIEFSPTHLSCYMLTLEKNTPLFLAFKNKNFVTTEIKTQLFMKTSMQLEKLEFFHYEISNFTRHLKNRSQHNSNYWNMMNGYDGYGPAAHSFLKHLDGRKERSWNKADVRAYIQDILCEKQPIEDYEILSSSQHMLECILVGLRTSDGINIKRFNRMFKSDFNFKFKDILDYLIAEKLGETKLSDNAESFNLTLAGWVYLDSIVEIFADKVL